MVIVKLRGRHGPLFCSYFHVVPGSRFSEAFLQADWGVRAAFLYTSTLLFQCFEAPLVTACCSIFGPLDYRCYHLARLVPHVSCISDSFCGSIPILYAEGCRTLGAYWYHTDRHEQWKRVK